MEERNWGGGRVHCGGERGISEEREMVSKRRSIGSDSIRVWRREKVDLDIRVWGFKARVSSSGLVGEELLPCRMNCALSLPL